MISLSLPATIMHEQNTLTPMERRVVRLLTLGCTVRQTAAVLRRSHHTIDNHKGSAMKKLGVHNAATLTRTALQLGITSLDDRLTPEEEELKAES